MTPFPPGTLFDYLAVGGDTLPALAARFYTSVEEIRQANPNLPAEVTTLPAGYPMQMPAYYVPLTGPRFPILPDSEVVNGPSAVGFDLRQELASRPGYVQRLDDYAYRIQRPAWQVVEVVARNYSVNPRVLLALLEHQTQALSRPFPSGDDAVYPLGYRDPRYRGLFRQLIWAAELLNDGYYGWRAGTLTEIELADGLLVRPDPWLNAGTVAVQLVFAEMYGEEDFARAVGPEGFAASYRALWGDPFALEVPIMPGNLQQPELALPFVPGRVWDFTGGPHYSWGRSLPLGALDFGPPAVQTGCVPSSEWIAAPADGVIARSEQAIVVLDLDGDGDERTGWSLFFFHVATEGRIASGSEVRLGDPLGHPSCEGGQATGTHFHLARRYNGEWLPADGPIPFVMDGWVPKAGAAPYEGTLTRGSRVVRACTCSDALTRIVYEFP
jgi:phage tail protein X